MCVYTCIYLPYFGNVTGCTYAGLWEMNLISLRHNKFWVVRDHNLRIQLDIWAFQGLCKAWQNTWQQLSNPVDNNNPELGYLLGIVHQWWASVLDGFLTQQALSSRFKKSLTALKHFDLDTTRVWGSQGLQ